MLLLEKADRAGDPCSVAFFSGASSCGSQAVQARRVCAVRSGELRSKGSAPQPRQKVGIPPSRFAGRAARRTPICPGGARGRIDGAEMQQGEQGAGGVVRIGDTAGQIGPGPPARGGVGIGMLLPILLAEQPFAKGELLLGSERAGLMRKRFDGERGDPGGEIGVDRPTAIACTLARRKRTARRATGCCAWPAEARAMVTKLVNGVASRKPPFSGWIDSSTRKRTHLRDSRIQRARGLTDGAW